MKNLRAKNMGTRFNYWAQPVAASMQLFILHAVLPKTCIQNVSIHKIKTLKLALVQEVKPKMLNLDKQTGLVLIIRIA
jgi:hypothetical protein